MCRPSSETCDGEREAVFLRANSSLSLGTAEHSPWYTSPVVLSRCCYCRLLLGCVRAFTSNNIYSQQSVRSRHLATLHAQPPTASSSSSPSPNNPNQKLRVVVIGGGWAGYSFCESISTNSINEQQGIEIILLDASKQAKGGLAGGYRDGSSNN